MNRRTKIITVYSPQGGSGKTTAALAVAAASAQRGYKTLLVDGAIYGSVQVPLHISKSDIGGLDTIINQHESGRTSEALIDYAAECVIEHKNINNLFILTNNDPVAMDKLREAEAEAIISTIESLEMDIIVVDTSSELSEFNMSLIEKSSKVLIPIKGDISSIWRYKLFYDVCLKAELPTHKLGIVLNMTNKNYSLSSEEIAEKCQTNVIINIPDFGDNFRKKSNEGILPFKLGGKAKRMFAALAETILKF